MPQLKAPVLDSCLATALSEGTFSALEGLIVELPFDSRSGTESLRVLFRGGVAPGAEGSSGPVLWDLASLTKPLVATLALLLLERTELEQPLERGPLGGSERMAPGLGKVSLDDLLRHRSRLSAWTPLYSLCSRPSEVSARLLAAEWWGARRGTYSDLGYILAGRLLEKTRQEGLDSLVRLLLCEPLELETPRYRPLSGPEPVCRSRLIGCTIDTAAEVALAQRLWRLEIGRLAPPEPGQVQDGNARFLGPSGHAGLFATIDDLVTLASAWLPGSWANRRLKLGPERLAWALRGRGSRRFGWEARTTRNSAGPSLPGEAFGHTGFVGGSLWLDPQQRRISALLGYRTDPFSDLKAVRRRFHGLAHARPRG